MKRLTIYLQIILLLAVAGCQDDKGKSSGVPVSMKFFLFSKMNPVKDITLGVIADFPVNADNLKYKIKADGTMETADQLHWGKNQSESSAFFIYSPYNSGYTGKSTIAVAVQADQSSMENLESSDFISAFLKMKPDNRGTDITLTHQMNVLQIPLAVKGGKEVSKVTVENIIANERIDVKTGEVTLGTTKQFINAYKEPGSNTFCCIFPAQELSFRARVTFSTGEETTLQSDAALAKWNGKIYRFEDIQISTEDKTVTVPASKISIKDWMTADIPENPAAEPIMNLADILRSGQPDGKEIDFSLEGITATAIAENKELDMAIFEDASGAAPVFLGGNLTDLKEGTRLSGRVTMKLGRADGRRTVTLVRTNKASIEREQPVPLTECTFAGLPSMRDSGTYRRTIFHNVTIESPFSDGSAYFTQDGTRVKVICEGQDELEIKANVSDLIGFPVTDGDSMAIYIPDHTALTHFIVTREESGFTNITAPGMYDISDMGNPRVLFAYDGKNQLTVTKDSYGYATQVSDLRQNKSLLIEISGFQFSPGQSYEFFVEAYGHYDLSKGDGYAECFYLDDERIWLIDKYDRNIGYIIAYEK